MSRLASALILTLAACGASSSSEPPSTAARPPSAAARSASPSPAPVPAPVLDCGTVDMSSSIRPPGADTASRCLLDAFTTNRAATLRWIFVTDEGGKIFTTYRVIPGSAAHDRLLEVTTDNRADGYAAAPGIHTQRCRSVKLEPTTGGGSVLYPEQCV